MWIWNILSNIALGIASNAIYANPYTSIDLIANTASGLSQCYLSSHESGILDNNNESYGQKVIRYVLDGLGVYYTYKFTDIHNSNLNNLYVQFTAGLTLLNSLVITDNLAKLVISDVSNSYNYVFGEIETVN